MTPKCDWEDCEKEAKYKIANMKINLCEEHFKKSNEEPVISLLKETKSLSSPEKMLIKILKQNGEYMPISKLMNCFVFTEDVFCETIENLLTKEIIKIE